MPEPLLTTAEAALLLGLSPRTLANWRLRGGGPAFRKLGDMVRYTPRDLDAWLDQRLRTSTSDPGPPLQPARARR